MQYAIQNCIELETELLFKYGKSMKGRVKKVGTKSWSNGSKDQMMDMTGQPHTDLYYINTVCPYWLILYVLVISWESIDIITYLDVAVMIMTSRMIHEITVLSQGIPNYKFK